VRVALVTALLALALPALAGSATTTTGLRGHVTIGPLTPVCTLGTPCSGPAKNTAILFQRASKIYRVVTDSYGNYRAVLGGGSYAVRSPRGMSTRPAVVTVVTGRMRIVNLTIDTGIR
jgi:hypothetical protein